MVVIMRHRNGPNNSKNNDNDNYNDMRNDKNSKMVLITDTSLPHHSLSTKLHNVVDNGRKTFIVWIFFGLCCFLLLGLRISRVWTCNSTSANIYSGVEYLPLSNLITEEKLVYDIIVVGSGPAGLSAALFATRAGWSVLVVGSIHGGMLSQALWLDNFPSFTETKWLEKTQFQIHQLGTHLAPPGLTITELVPTFETYYQLYTSHEKIVLQTKSVILAMGSTANRLNLPGETTLWGRNLHSCVICDGSNYHMKNIMVVGGGDAAMEAAVYLLQHKFAQTIQLVHRQNTFERITNPSQLHYLKSQTEKNVKFHTPYTVQEWITTTSDGEFQGAQIQHVETKELKFIKCDAVFVMIGSKPNTSWLPDNLQLPNNDDNDTSTSYSGVFAAGDIIDSKYRQAITASASGAKAAMDVDHYLQAMKHSPQSISTKKKLSQPQVVLERKMITETKPSYGISCNMIELKCIEELTQKYPVVVFSKSYCPYCRRALDVLSLEGVEHPKIIDLTTHPDAQTIQSKLQSLTGRRTVPNIFVGGINIGGGDETVSLHKQQKLAHLLKQANAI